jgi:hypothetical protein
VLDHQALEASLAALIERHEILRTTYLAGEHGPVQVVWRHLPWRIVRLSRGEGSADADVPRIAHAELTTPFDLEREPCARRFWRSVKTITPSS